jgi:hypothetical protein
MRGDDPGAPIEFGKRQLRFFDPLLGEKYLGAIFGLLGGSTSQLIDHRG